VRLLVAVLGDLKVVLALTPDQRNARVHQCRDGAGFDGQPQAAHRALATVGLAVTGGGLTAEVQRSTYRSQPFTAASGSLVSQ
jgi:hypothetical protein